MGFFESSIVVYLREIYYPDGFSFPLEPIAPQIAGTEFVREFFSLLMIISVAALAKRSFYERFANFLFIFAIWDISYYVFLKIILGWPASIMTWDILFLIPVPWTSPVLAPVIASLTMIGLAVIIYKFHWKKKPFNIQPREWILLVSGAFIIFMSFIWDFLLFFFPIHNDYDHLSVSEKLMTLSAKYQPETFNWWLFIVGLLVIIIGIYFIYKKNHNKNTV